MSKCGPSALPFDKMGQTISSIGRDLKPIQENPNDPCYPQLQAYLKCVDSHTDGLTEGDECHEETLRYKECRTANKEWKGKR